MRHIRWGDNDRYWGPFTFSSSAYRPFCIMLASWGGGEDDDQPCHLRFSWFWGTLIMVLPPIVRPWRQKIFPNWDAKTIARLGRDYYWDVDERSYGITMHNAGDVGNSTHLSIHYGRAGGSAMDSTIEQRWSCFLPWTQWRHVRRSLYDLEGKHFWSDIDSEARGYYKLGKSNDRWDIVRSWEGMCPTMKFKFRDFDSEEIEVTTRLEQREWRFGTGWFEWLSLFRRPNIIGSLCLEFSSETGRRKGSWKGGTLGHSITMQSGELHEAAFKRYCTENEMTFVGPA